MPRSAVTILGKMRHLPKLPNSQTGTQLRAMVRAPVAIVSGSLKVSINDLVQTKQVIDALRESPKASVSVLSGHAGAAARVLFPASQAFPEHRARNLRGVSWHGRSALPAHLSKIDQQLNATYSMLWHHTAPELGKLVDEAVSILGPERCGGSGELWQAGHPNWCATYCGGPKRAGCPAP